MKETYISFNFEDVEYNICPVIVKFFKKIDEKEKEKIAFVIKDVMKHYAEEGDCWDSDDLLIEEVLTKMEYKFEIIDVKYIIDC